MQQRGKRKRAVRVQSRHHTDDSATTAAVLLVTYPDHEDAAFHILDGRDRIEDGRVRAVEAVVVLDVDPSWVVVRRAGHSTVFHLPAPMPAARGAAVPACGGPPESTTDSEYRLVGRRVVSELTVCRDCARRQQPHTLDVVSCPGCGRILASGLLEGPRVSAIEGLEVACPEEDCSYTGPVDVSLDATVVDDTGGA